MIVSLDRGKLKLKYYILVYTHSVILVIQAIRLVSYLGL